MPVSLLAIDTSSEACSVALQVGGAVSFRFTDQPRKHAEQVLPMVDALLAEAEISLKALNGIAFGRGPGSFTGLRIAAGTVQGLAFGADLPVVPVSSLMGLAQTAWRVHGWQQVHAAFDARMGEVYWGSYQRLADGNWQLQGQEAVTPPSQVLQAAGIEPAEGWQGAGSGWCHAAVLEAQAGPLLACDAGLLPHAQDLLPLAQLAFLRGEAITAEQVVPVYLRNEVAAKSAARRS